MNLKFLSWQEGKYSDLWIIVHFFSGACGGSLLYMIGVSFDHALLTVFAVAVAWEIFESTFNLRENMINKFLDIIVGIFGFSVTFLWLPAFGFSVVAYEMITIIEMLVLLLVSSFGWKNYEMYNKLKKK